MEKFTVDHSKQAAGGTLFFCALAIGVVLAVMGAAQAVYAQTSPLILAPAEGTVWTRGTTQTIRWDPSFTTNSTVTLALRTLPGPGDLFGFSDGNLITTAPFTVPNSGSYNWLVPSTLSETRQYQIWVNSPTNISGKFSVIASGFTQPLPTVAISVSPASIPLGQSSIITWSSANATSCAASGAWVGVKNISGSGTISPSAQGTYTHTLTCSNSERSTTQSTTLIVTPPSALLYPVGGEVFQKGSTQTIRWDPSFTTNSTVTLALRTLPGPGDLFGFSDGNLITTAPFTVPNSGSYNWLVPSTLSETRQYQIWVNSPTNISGKFSVAAASSLPPPTLTLSASPTSITSGQSSTLSWSSTNATSCTASNGWSGAKSTSGSQSVSPTSNTTYNLSCTGSGGSASKNVTVTINPAPGVRGDLTGDGLVTLADLRQQIRMLIGSVPIDLATADLTGDGALTLADLRALVGILVGRGG